MIRRPPRSPLFPSPPLSRSKAANGVPPRTTPAATPAPAEAPTSAWEGLEHTEEFHQLIAARVRFVLPATVFFLVYYFALPIDRKSTRLNSSHSQISYAVFCL